MIKLEKITKKFKNLALDKVSFSLNKGDIVGLIGPNGAGKTTMMRIITGIIYPDTGIVTISGKNTSESNEFKNIIGYMPENSALYDDMTVENYLNFIAEARKIPKNKIKSEVKQIAEKTQIIDVINQKISTLSKGYKKRVSFAQAIIHNPEILILDEPTEGLDPNQKKEFYSIIKDFHKDKLVIISTHVLDEINQCSKVLLINKGKIILNTEINKLDVKIGENLNDLFYRLTKGKNT